MIQCLRNLDVVAVICEIEGDEMIARWVQIHPKKIATILGTEQELVEPKVENGMVLTVQVPADVTEVHTDVRFPIVRRTDPSVASQPESIPTPGNAD